MEHGFRKDRQSGSHIAMKAHTFDESGQTTTRTVVVPQKKEIPVGTLRNIIKHSGLDRGLFVQT